MSYTIHLTDDQFAILQDLVSEGMEVVLSPYDNIEVCEETELNIQKTIAAVAFFNSHSPDQ